MSTHETSHWLETAPVWEHESAPLPAFAEVAIIGAGIMGSALAYWLTGTGRRVLVVERNPAPAMGATGRNGGLIIQGSTRAYADDIRRIGRPAAREVYEFTRLNQKLVLQVLADERIDAGFAETPEITLAAEPQEADRLRESARALREDGFEARWLERKSIANRLGVEPGLEFVGALHRPRQGRLHSARYAVGVAAAAARRGARFAFSTPVQSIETSAGGAGWLVRTARTTVPVREVVIAVNAWGADLFSELDGVITPTRGHMLLTPPVDFRIIPWSAGQGFAYGRQLDSGELIFGGMRNARADMEVGHHPLPGQNVPPPAPEVVRALNAALSRYFPAAADVTAEHFWTGNMGFTPDEMPLVGRWPGRKGLWIMAGFSGRGMSYSQAVPQALAAQMTGEDGPAVPEVFDPARYLSG